MKYQICKMRGAFTACTCDSPGCIMRPGGGCTGHTLEALELGQESSMGESASQVAGAATLLLDFKQVGISSGWAFDGRGGIGLGQQQLCPYRLLG